MKNNSQYTSIARDMLEHQPRLTKEQARHDPACRNNLPKFVEGNDLLDWAILQACAYSDVFDYPMTFSEIHRYLVGVQSSPQDISSQLTSSTRLSRELSIHNGFWTLVGREHLVEIRKKRSHQSGQLWPLARRYGNLIAGLPFVRMVAVSGALAMDNLGHRSDIDYLVVTEPGRLWLCRALVISVVRLASLRGVTLCPNYFLTTNALHFPNASLYTAHELVQLKPLSGTKVFSRMVAENQWTYQFLPNASAFPNPVINDNARPPQSQRLGEKLLNTPLGGWLEAWEMQRKVRRFKGKSTGDGEAEFCADWCKGHFDGHARRTLQAYQERLDTLGVPLQYRLV